MIIKSKHKQLGARCNLENLTFPATPVEIKDQPGDSLKLPDVRKEVTEHLKKFEQEGTPSKKKLLVSQPFSPAARKNLHYNIMLDIESRLAGVTIGELLRDNACYRCRRENEIHSK
jgi:hypothetical protein